MNRFRSCLSVLAVTALVAPAMAQHQPSKSDPHATKPGAAQPADHGKPTPPPGMSEADMEACMAAATPGPMHKHLTQSVGTWKGQCTMWMPGAPEPSKSECMTVITPMMDGRFIRIESNGEMPGMGPFNGFGIAGFDNVSQKFQQTWMDNCGTGMATGTGELSTDGKTMTWTLTYNCPIKKGPVNMRQVQKETGPDTMMMQVFGENPATGKEEKMVEIAYTRVKTAAAPAHAPATHAPAATPAPKPAK